MIDDRTGDAHRDVAERHVALAADGGDGEAGAGEAQELFLHVGGDRGIAGVLHVTAVDRESRQALLVVRGERGGQIDGARTLGAVEAPDRLRTQRVHVDRFAAVAPARRDGDRQADVGDLELVFARGRFGHAADAGIGDHALDRLAGGVAQILLQELGRANGHVHRLLFERLAHAQATVVDGRADADFGEKLCVHMFVLVLCGDTGRDIKIS